MTVTVDQSKLVLNSFAAYFQNELTSGQVVSWKEYDGKFDDRNGLQISEQIVPNYTVSETSNGVADISAAKQDSVFGSELFRIDRTFGTNMAYGDFEKIKSLGDARESESLKAHARQLAHSIDRHVLGTAMQAANEWVGSPGAVVDDFDEAASAYTRMKSYGVEDGDMHYVMAFLDRQKLGNQIGKLPAPDAEAVRAIRRGFGGDLGGIPTLFTQQLPTITVGSRVATATVAVDGAAQNVDYSAVAIASANGRYLTQDLDIKGLTIGHTIKKGEVFTIAGVNQYDPRQGANLGTLQQFTVVDDFTAAATTGTIRIFPAIVIPDSGTNGNTAHATVAAAPADAAAISFVGAAGTTYLPRLLVQKAAVCVATMPLTKPMEGMYGTRKLNKIPLSVRMWGSSDVNTGQHVIRFDVALTANIRERRRVVKFNGGA